MINKIVNEWIAMLCKDHNVTCLKELPKEVIEEEIEKVKDNIANNELANYQIGISCNNYYKKCLEEALRTVTDVT